MSRLECDDDDVFSPVRCSSLDNRASTTEDSLTDLSYIDSSTLSAKDFTRFQSNPSNEIRFIGKSSSSSFSEVNDQGLMNLSNSSGTKGIPINKQQNISGHSNKFDASDFLHKHILKKEIDFPNVNVRNKAASKDVEKFSDQVHIKKTCHNKLGRNDAIKASVTIATPRKEKYKAKTHCSNEDNTLSVLKNSNNCASSSYLHGNKKSLVTSATQTEISFEKLVSSSTSSIKENSADMHKKNMYSTDVPMNRYQVSVKKIIHDAVSIECDKIRQLLYAQRMSSFRRIDQILAQHEFRIMMMQERLLKTVEELAQIYVLLNKSNTEPL